MGAKRWFLVGMVGLILCGNTFGRLVVHLKLDETSGNIAPNSSGNGHDGTLEGNTQWALGGKYTGALQFAGSGAVVLPGSAMGMKSGEGSFACWINTGTPAGINTIFWAGDNTTGGGFGPENEMTVHIEAAGTYWRGGELSFYSPNAFIHSDPEKGAAASAPVNPVLVSDNQWHHVAAVWSSQENKAQLFIDGKLISQAAYGPSDFELSYMYLGRMANSTRYYTGLLDDVQIYSHALSPAEVLLAMAGGRSAGVATKPSPEDGKTDVPRDTELSWTAGVYPGTHDVYLGTGFDDVNNASRANPGSV
ncbi:MAG: LamG domain-containing protein, partial [Sedimentisphaerales bacterium]|nr:LamG domain-containing protein [Sedimentisphaerales bacterium]